MRLTSQEEYGLRCLLQVAQCTPPDRMTVADIARAEGLGAAYAGRLMQHLRAAGLVSSTPGPGGGFCLARPAAEISIWDGLQSLGDPLFCEEQCVCLSGQERDCVHLVDCSLRPLWRTVNYVVQELLEGISLADLMRREKGMEAWLAGDLAKGL